MAGGIQEEAKTGVKVENVKQAADFNKRKRLCGSSVKILASLFTN